MFLELPILDRYPQRKLMITIKLDRQDRQQPDAIFMMQHTLRTEFGRWTAIANRNIKIVERRPVVGPEAQNGMQATRKAIALRPS